MVCPDCELKECLGAGCTKLFDDLTRALKDIEQLKAVLPKGSLLLTPKVESGEIKQGSVLGSTKVSPREICLHKKSFLSLARYVFGGFVGILRKGVSSKPKQIKNKLGGLT